jgi:hypothetical protein
MGCCISDESGITDQFITNQQYTIDNYNQVKKDTNGLISVGEYVMLHGKPLSIEPFGNNYQKIIYYTYDLLKNIHGI